MAAYPTSYLTSNIAEECMGYPTLEDRDEERMQTNKNRYFAPRSVGAGFRHLQQQAADPQGLLKGLLKELSVELLDCEEEPPAKKKRKELKTVGNNMSDETILQLARQVPSQMSLLASLLKVLHDDGGSVSTRAFLKTCALSVRPGLTPALMDAKEMVLAGLHFLSTCDAIPSSLDKDIITTTSSSSSSSLSPPPPWIRPVQLLGDLEKRVYEKVGNWTLEQILPAVAELEDIFYASGESLKFLPRTRFCPTQIPNQVEHDLLLLKGNPPVSTTKKIVRKKKSTTATTTATTSSSKLLKTDEDPVAHEATRIMSETSKGNTSPDDGELA